MVISQTPYRISFFGGGTDYPTWFREHGGAVLATSIDKYCYISVRPLPPFFEHKSRIVYSAIESVKDNKDINHPAVRGVLAYLGIDEGLEIHHDGDLPARSGIGSSSSFTVGLLNALLAMKGRFISKFDLGALAIHIEQDVIKEMVGSQDQASAANGGLNKIVFNRDGGYEVEPLILNPNLKESLNDHMILFFTGFSRNAAVIAQSKVNNFEKKQASLHTIRQYVDDAVTILQSNQPRLESFGELLHESWMLKRDLSNQVSNTSLDDIYLAGRSAGAIGGKLLGAGGGGFMLFFARPENHDRIRARLSGLIEVPFKFDNSGSRIVFCNPHLSTPTRKKTMEEIARFEESWKWQLGPNGRPLELV